MISFYVIYFFIYAVTNFPTKNVRASPTPTPPPSTTEAVAAAVISAAVAARNSASRVCHFLNSMCRQSLLGGIAVSFTFSVWLFAIPVRMFSFWFGLV